MTALSPARQSSTAADAGEDEISVGEPDEPTGQRNTRMQWRDWSLPVKLGAVTLVPIVLVLVLGGITLANQMNQADRYERVDRLAQLNSSVVVLLDRLQQERTDAVRALTRHENPGRLLREIRLQVDGAADQLTTAADRAVPVAGGIADARAAATEQLGRLSGLRERMGQGQVGPVQAVNEYTLITSSLLALDTALVAGVGEDAVGSTTSALHELLVAKEQVAVQQALIGFGVDRGDLQPAELNLLRTAEVRLADRLAEFRTSATATQRAAFDATLGSQPSETRDRIIETLLTGQDSGEGSVAEVNVRAWNDSSTAVFAGLGDVAKQLGEELTTTAADLADSASSGTGLWAVVLFAALIVAGVVVFMVARQLMRSLRVLRSSALEVAEHELPQAVREIQQGGRRATAINPVAVDSHDEIGQVAKAFDRVHREAVRLAEEQAGMRAGYAGVFVNLSRRSQSLVQRQLGLIERLERDEEDADQLATLFQLDHLATRMRRNNENLMVLSGQESGRKTGPPVTASDVMRAAVSEIEQYQRVVVRTPPAVKVRGHAASDLVRLIAELLDNATAFSPPETQVTVTSRVMPGRTLAINVIDNGIGMKADELAAANDRLEESGPVDVATSRRMGLFVVGRLAAKHGFGVVLMSREDDTGVQATVSVPADLVSEDAQSPDAATGIMSPAADVSVPQQHTPARSSFADFTADSPAAPPLPQERPGAPARGLTPADGDLPRRTPGGEWTPASPASQPPLANSEVSGTALFAPLDADGQAPAGQRSEAPPAPSVPESPPTTKSGLPARKPRSRRDPEPANAAGEPGASDWWNRDANKDKESEPAVPEVTAVEETTPIFDEMLSAWFRKVTDPSNPATEMPEPPEPPQRDAATDPAAEAKAAKAAAKVARAEQGKKAARAEVAKSSKDAAKDEARDEKEAQESTPGAQGADAAPGGALVGGAPHAEPNGEPNTEARGDQGASDWTFAADDGWRAVAAASKSEPAAFTEKGLPRRRRGEQLMPGSAAGEATGLPASSAAREVGGLPPRDPAQVRSRLSSFQRGVHRGRQDASSPTYQSFTAPPPEPAAPEPVERPAPSPAPRGKAKAAENGSTEGLAAPLDSRDARETPEPGEPESAVTPAGLPQRRPRKGSRPSGRPPARPDAPSESPARETTREPSRETSRTAAAASAAPAAEWAFSSDERWRSVQERAEAEPTSFTDKGLPRRNRGDKLLPGNAGPADAPGNAGGDPTRAAVGRDPADVRGRLSSFQQGIRRGRHQTAQATTETTDEKGGSE